jgi:hypothetical protein
MGTSVTVSRNKADIKVLVAVLVFAQMPALTDLTLRTSDGLRFPINGETANVKPFPSFRLPTASARDRAEQVNVVVTLAGKQLVG